MRGSGAEAPTVGVQVAQETRTPPARGFGFKGQLRPSEPSLSLVRARQALGILRTKDDPAFPGCPAARSGPCAEAPARAQSRPASFIRRMNWPRPRRSRLRSIPQPAAEDRVDPMRDEQPTPIVGGLWGRLLHGLPASSGWSRHRRRTTVITGAECQNAGVRPAPNAVALPLNARVSAYDH